MGTGSSIAGHQSKSSEASPGLLFICGGSRGRLRRPRHSFGRASLRPARLRGEAIGAIDANYPITFDRILDCYDKRACGYRAGTILAVGVAEASARSTVARTGGSFSRFARSSGYPPTAVLSIKSQDRRDGTEAARCHQSCDSNGWPRRYERVLKSCLILIELPLGVHQSRSGPTGPPFGSAFEGRSERACQYRRDWREVTFAAKRRAMCYHWVQTKECLPGHDAELR